MLPSVSRAALAPESVDGQGIAKLGSQACTSVEYVLKPGNSTLAMGFTLPAANANVRSLAPNGLRSVVPAISRKPPSKSDAICPNVSDPAAQVPLSQYASIVPDG